MMEYGKKGSRKMPFEIITVNVYFMFHLWKFCVPKIIFIIILIFFFIFGNVQFEHKKLFHSSTRVKSFKRMNVTVAAVRHAE